MELKVGVSLLVIVMCVRWEMGIVVGVGLEWEGVLREDEEG